MKGSDNPFPSVLLVPQTTVPTNPNHLGERREYLRDDASGTWLALTGAANPADLKFFAPLGGSPILYGNPFGDDVLDVTSYSDDFSGSSIDGKWGSTGDQTANGITNPSTGKIRMTTVLETGMVTATRQFFQESLTLRGSLWQCYAHLEFPMGQTTPTNGWTAGLFVVLHRAGTGGGYNGGNKKVAVTIKWVGGTTHVGCNEGSVYIAGETTPVDPYTHDTAISLVSSPGSAFRITGKGELQYTLDTNPSGGAMPTWTTLATVDYSALFADVPGSVAYTGEITATIFGMEMLPTVGGTASYVELSPVHVTSHSWLVDFNEGIYYFDPAIGVTRLPLGNNGQYLQVVNGKPVWGAAPSGGGGGGGGGGGISTVFTYTAPNDTTGLFYYAGLGGTYNPVPYPFTAFSSAAPEGATLLQLSSRTQVPLDIPQADDNFIGIDFGLNCSLIPNHLSLQDRPVGYGNNLTQIRIEGKPASGGGWEAIQTSTVTYTSLWANIAITTSTAYRALRIVRSALTTSSDKYLCLGQWEWYGTFNVG